MVAADDREKGHWPFFAPHFYVADCVGIGGRLVSIAGGRYPTWRISARSCMKMNISGTTNWFDVSEVPIRPVISC